MLTAGISDKAIVKASRAAAADLIPIGTHGRISVEHVPFGGTAKRIVRAAPRPVPAVRPGASALLRC
jgi:nucleotide-binding universal stress UspA family protein